MNFLRRLAEQRIEEAIERGELDNLPGAGKPLRLDDNTHVPAELRAMYRLLKNSGYLPPELELRGDIAHAEALLRAARDPDDRLRAARRLDALLMRLEHQHGRKVNLARHDHYRRKLMARFDAADDDGAPEGQSPPPGGVDSKSAT